MKPSEIKIGDVFRITMNKANGVVPKPGDTSRNKYFVVLGFDDDGNVYGGVIFNSYININLPPFVQAMQHPVKGKDYEFLSHDSYIDCSSIKAVKKNKLLKSSSLGTLNTEDISSVCEKIKHNSRISKIELKRFGLL
ncbi:hypothetical protein IX307_000848 [Bacteroides pyogenes]|uniref:hypothetical protein n=2 Tax=Bacteroides pyogenes TaxID=310300 RepID=UPI001BACF3FD|nr:hypothetical protein [Bacteroides pyogenes]MBR8706804.1 hypothetical protein [Bacteroides pyogenes]MBR8719620.1 hypothetical protein [Bacteroides pyogenes]MBR8726137.1 hypothetical protein [Bacteroides pyogenes]MBR8739440.1 hypothetical protein [Bacteroides pyogenes]MBR8755301.1 hypothetical protein [Bacteroides pyogenes]